MSNNTNTGGPAFPHIDSGCGRFEEGMTLRDYFAAKAMQGMLVNEKFPHTADVVGKAYKMADAMLNARGE